MMSSLSTERYQDTGEQFSGGFGRVFKCRDVHLERLVAIKTYKDEIINSRDRLNDEITSLLKMRSNHVVQVYDVITDCEDGFLGLVMEFLEGEDLSLPSDGGSILKLLWQIASGIFDIHAAGLIHRDIKLSNMKMDKGGVVKIFDFGLTKQGTLGVYSSNLLGTHGYAAPELYIPSESFSRAIDVYAFAFLVLDLLGLDKSIHDLLISPPVFPVSNPYKNTILNEYPELINLLYCGLSANPLDRPTMKDFKELLERYLLNGHHRATLIYDNKIHYLNKDKTRLVLNFGIGKRCIIEYDGDNFIMKDVSGEVRVNNDRVNEDRILSGAYVITLFGDSKEIHLPFATSNPEVLV